MGQQQEAARKEIIGSSTRLAMWAVDRQYARQPGVWEKYGAAGREKAIADASYHLSFLAEAVGAGEPSLFLEYCDWVAELFLGLHLPDGAFGVALECTAEAIQELLSPQASEAAAPVLKAALARGGSPVPETPTFFTPDNPLAGSARQYLSHLLGGEKGAARDLVLALLDSGTRIQDLYLLLIQPSQRELGRLWQVNRISVAQEHYCTAATQVIMSQLLPRIFEGKKNGRRLVAAGVGGELHELGIRMVADLFELDGWDTVYLGANTPSSGIVRTISDVRPDILAISATMTFHLGELESVIRDVRASAAQTPKILVGGRVLNSVQDLWQKTGADGYGNDGSKALQAAARLLE